jgi:hypothetical protein
MCNISFDRGFLAICRRYAPARPQKDEDADTARQCRSSGPRRRLADHRRLSLPENSGEPDLLDQNLHQSVLHRDIVSEIGSDTDPIYVMIEKRYKEKITEVQQQISAVIISPEMQNTSRQSPGPPVCKRYAAISAAIIAFSKSRSAFIRRIDSATIKKFGWNMFAAQLRRSPASDRRTSISSP